MEYHCISDAESKDADGLDRVHIKDLDTKYLRTTEAKNRVLFVYGY